ncbi:MAG TPA: HAMP domain-containing sensor histidine kinase [Nannocystaceae bacterium]|nr:HAMP domain-containing sensor histidine kinase [Nannocystaceae bacterium]
MNVARKLTLALVSGIVVVHAGSAACDVSRERAVFEQDFARDARVLGRGLGHAVEQAWITRGESDALEIIEHATARESHVDIRWVWPDGRDGRAPAVGPEELDRLDGGAAVVIQSSSGDGPVYTYVPVQIPGHGLGAIEIADPFVDERAYMRSSMMSTVITTTALVALCALATWVLGVTLIGRPVRRLVAQARAIGRGDLEQRLGLPVTDELGELAHEMDLMCDRLQEARARLQTETRTRIRAVEQLRHADRLTTVGTLASGIAHELGTPINVIDGHAALIREAGPSTEASESADVISRQCKRMAAIIRQLLDFSRRGGQQGTSTDAVMVARQTLQMVAPLTRKQNVESSIDTTEPETPVAIAFDRLQQVIANLIVNGLHAMPMGGQLRVRISTRRARPPGLDREGAYVAVSVEDTGLGIADDVADRVFEPFFTTKDVGEGTGLGLAVAYGIVQDHGGWIELESTPRQGSTFTVCLPLEGAA